MEHFSPLKETKERLYDHIGSHLLSLLLVAGSYFRMEGTSEDAMPAAAGGGPLDVRHRFDPALLATTIREVYTAYYAGFCKTSPDAPPCDPDLLAARMVAEMGVDRHMDETLRTTDQQRMSDEAFHRFLVERGIPRSAVAGFQKGAGDLQLRTGPHLGPFNGAFSLPEVTDFLSRAAGLCIISRFRRQRQIPVVHPYGALAALS